MTTLGLIALVAAVNPARLRGIAVARHRGAAVIAAGLTVSVVVVPLVAGAGPLLDALDLAPSTMRLAAGIVALLAGGTALVHEPSPVDDVPPGWRGGVAPLGFPLLLRPEVGVLAVAVGADVGAGPTLAVLVPGVLLGAVAATMPAASGRAAAVWSGLGRAIGAVLVVAGVGLGVDGALSV